MKTLIIYDSHYGNTEKIASAIAKALSPSKALGEGGGEVKILRPAQAKVSDLISLDLLVVGSPTHGGWPTPAIRKFLNEIPDGALKNIKVAAFDTRFSKMDQGIGIRLLIRILSFAASKIAEALKDKGGDLKVEGEGFIVEGKEGPIKQGELERAAEWAKNLL
ncbi:MAG: flavodoxin family protein [Candidatus Portnoybacteria bacterium]|nr:flavodoxin family protein [Candidatus Portnoybacteria bacterium]